MNTDLANIDVVAVVVNLGVVGQQSGEVNGMIRIDLVTGILCFDDVGG